MKMNTIHAEMKHHMIQNPSYDAGQVAMAAVYPSVWNHESTTDIKWPIWNGKIVVKGVVYNSWREFVAA
jgi:hypothetical protein